MPNTKEKYLITIAGPTAVGKTSLAIRLAQNLQTEIISADSRQFFKELEIGTAKPTPAELAAVPHHFVNTHHIGETYSAGDFERDALVLLSRLFEVYDRVVMVGGSGFYIKALLEGLDALPAPLPGLRERLTLRLQAEGLPSLQKEIADLDPDFAQTAEFENPQRVIRALEVYITEGRPISYFQQTMKKSRPFKSVAIALDRDRQELYKRIDDRMDQMLEEGLVQEAQDLLPYRTAHALQTVGYKEVYGFLDGDYDEQEMVRLLKQNSRRYAKRQLTWFRHQGEFKWFHPDDFEQILKYTQQENLGA
ncbi:tRNA dimethylallyltransferase [Dyadobacter jejuensis]|uniref:tRNA dimethylallyltransferase n=1 Tax=Dyadobacter jejuensis TaxID=1082580 RepID=A0A316ATN5_9BACT|nr:tRNA (adenosine(37)-N6)-dimethylallyltransferase MiaA [Dyadobacter jejuensis]PWJ60649.1 tRNA dimethylallyltransferase [Dyadobacter jejuensis]